MYITLIYSYTQIYECMHCLLATVWAAVEDMVLIVTGCPRYYDNKRSIIKQVSLLIFCSISFQFLFISDIQVIFFSLTCSLMTLRSPRPKREDLHASLSLHRPCMILNTQRSDSAVGNNSICVANKNISLNYTVKFIYCIISTGWRKRNWTSHV